MRRFSRSSTPSGVGTRGSAVPVMAAVLQPSVPARRSPPGPWPGPPRRRRGRRQCHRVDGLRWRSLSCCSQQSNMACAWAASPGAFVRPLSSRARRSWLRAPSALRACRLGYHPICRRDIPQTKDPAVYRSEIDLFRVLFLRLAFKPWYIRSQNSPAFETPTGGLARDSRRHYTSPALESGQRQQFGVRRGGWGMFPVSQAALQRRQVVCAVLSSIR